MKPLILASQSPRRRELLNEAGFSFDVVSVKVSEIPDKNLNVNEQILDIARRKARAALSDLKSSRSDSFVVLSADTEVIFDNAPLGKPENPEDAFRILSLLSGKVHQVMTGVCIIDSETQREVSHLEITKVVFKQLNSEQIRAYIKTGEPMDKAGAYGIQGQGRDFVEKFEGSYENVVGLPVQVVRLLLDELNFKNLAEQSQPAKLLAVSKLQTTEKIRALYNLGQRSFAENYVQEALDKIDSLQDLGDIEWHFIGHLQKNKAKHVVGRFHLIHSVDSLELAEVLNKNCHSRNIQQSILVQVNLAQEATKSGFDRSTLLASWIHLTRLDHLKICGFMTMPPLTETGESVRPYFRQLRELREELAKNTNLAVHPLNELSMGTSHDFKVAIEEGATIVRLGTILFGERPVKR